MCKPLVCFRGHGCGCRPSWSGGNSPPSAPLEGSQAWSQRGVLPRGSDGALSPCLSWGSTSHASQTLNLFYIGIFLGDSNIWILSVHFMYLFCICWVCMPSQNWAYLTLRVPFKNRVTKTRPCIKWAPLGRTTLYFIRNLLPGIMWLGLNKKPPLKWDWRKEDHSGRIAAQVFPRHFHRTSWSSREKEPPGLLRLCCQRQEAVLKPMDPVKADAEEEWWHRVPQSDLGVNMHRRVRLWNNLCPCNYLISFVPWGSPMEFVNIFLSI